MRTSFLYILLITLFSVQLAGQVSYGGKPFPYQEKKASIELIKMPLFNYNWVISELESDLRHENKKPLPVAWNYEVDFDPSNSGYWQDFNGTKVWRLEIFSKNAHAISVFFDDFKLEPGARIFVYDPAREEIFGSFDHRSNKPSGNFPVSYVSGEKLVVELQVDKDIEDWGSLRIGSISHAFADIFKKSDKKDTFFGRSGNCNIDINCPSGDEWQDVKRAVCRIIFKRTAGTSISELCTGTLINNTERDQTNYLFTANHCIDKEFPAQSAIFYFEYESPECDGTDGKVNKTIGGSTLLSTSDSLDFSLLLLSETIPATYDPFFAGWTLSSSPAQSSVSIHHPQGDVKKISTDNDPLTSQYQSPLSNDHWLNESIPSGFWRVVRWNEGTTEGGSSGAPLFNTEKLIVGNLTGGDAICGNPVNDYFSKFHLCWDYYPDSLRQVKYWLDRNNTGLTSLRGYPDTTQTIMKIMEQYDDLSIYRSLISSTSINTQLSGIGQFTVFAPLNNAFANLSPPDLHFLFSGQYDKLQDIPGYHIVNEKLISEDLFNGMLLNTNTDVQLKINRLGSELFVDYAKIIVPDIIADNGVIHIVDEVLFPVGKSEDAFTIFPNPAYNDLWITNKDGSMKGAELSLYSINGAFIAKYVIEDDKLSRLMVSDFTAGIYIVEIKHNNKVFRSKLVITNNHLP